MKKLDHVDLKILKKLQLDGRITNLQLSKDIGLSPAPTLERVKKLEQSGYLKSYHARVNEKKMGIGIVAFIQISIIRQKSIGDQSFVKEIEKIDEVVECYQVTGASDYLIKVMFSDIEAFDKMVKEKFNKIECIRQMQTQMVISQDKHSYIVPYNYNNNKKVRV